MLVLFQLFTICHDKAFHSFHVVIFLEIVIYFQSSVKIRELYFVLDVNLIQNLLASQINIMLGLFWAHWLHRIQLLLIFEIQFDSFDEQLLCLLTCEQLLALRIDFKSDLFFVLHELLLMLLVLHKFPDGSFISRFIEVQKLSRRLGHIKHELAEFFSRRLQRLLVLVVLLAL